MQLELQTTSSKKWQFPHEAHRLKKVSNFTGMRSKGSDVKITIVDFERKTNKHFGSVVLLCALRALK
jgi:hypothetical protein